MNVCYCSRSSRPFRNLRDTTGRKGKTRHLWSAARSKWGEARRCGVQPVRAFSDGERCQSPTGDVGRISSREWLISLDEEITIQSRAASPGLMANPVDRLYFLPFDAVRTYSVEQLTGFMLRYSDNTATDALLHRLGGTAALTEFLVHQLHVDGICVERTMHELLTYYYGLHRYDVRGPDQGMRHRIGRIVGNIRRMKSPYVCRLNAEENLVDSGEDTCTPRAIADVLTRLMMNPKYALVYSHMQHCATNKRRVAEGLREHRPRIKSFGHKTGSIGAIANDVGIIHFNSGHSAVIAVLTCLSSARMPVRDEQIAGVTCAIIRQW